MVLLSAFVGIIGTLKIDAAMRTYYFDYNQQPRELKKYLSNIFSFSILLALLFWIISYFIGPHLFGFFKNEEVTYFPYGILAVSSGLLGLCSAVYFIYLKNKIELKEFAFYVILGVLATVGFQFFFIVVEKQGAVGALKGTFISQAIVFSILVLTNWRLIRFSFDKKMIRQSLNFSLPVIPFLFINWFVLRGDRFLLEQYFSLEVVGQYALLITLVGISFLVMNALDNAIRPFLFEAFKQVEKKTIEINDYVQFYIAMALLVSSGIILIGSNLRLFTDNSTYLEIIPYFTLAGFVVFLRSYTRIFNEQLYFKKQSKAVTLLAFITLVILVGAYMILLPKFKIMGALYSLLLANVLSGGIFYYLAQKKFRVNYFLKKIVTIPLAIFGVIFLFNFLSKRLDVSIQIFGILQFLMTVLLIYSFYRKTLNRLYHDYIIK